MDGTLESFLILLKRPPFSNPATDDFVKVMMIIHKETQKALDEAAGQMKAQYDKGKCTARNYQIGDRVWLDSNQLEPPSPKEEARRQACWAL